jgi:hypothetical protein
VDEDRLLWTRGDAHAAVATCPRINKVYAVTMAMYGIHWAHLGADTALGAGPRFVVARGRKMGDDGQRRFLGVVFPEKVQRAGQKASPAP